MKNNNFSANKNGFTLLELLVVLVILGLLISIAAPNLFEQLGAAKRDTAAIQIVNLGASLDLYRLNVGRYPSQDDGLNAMVKAPADAGSQWKGPYVKKEQSLKDPWGNLYVYTFPGKHNKKGYDLYSLGADGQEGGEGDNQDITNW
ncbi:MAG: type II secretion system major pseudopilin GspG [Magnetococcales bacterium]|nr:type II secretion system major pseudopilin GspG [Magnetococcales bacterium]